MVKSRVKLASPGFLEALRAIVNVIEIGAGYGSFGVAGAAVGFVTRLRQSRRELSANGIRYLASVVKRVAAGA